MKTPSLTAVAVAAVLGLAGCGLDRSSGSGGLSQSEQDKFVKYSHCMREQGVDVPDLKGGSDKVAVPSSTVLDPKVEAANAICRIYAPNDAAGHVSGAEEDQALKTAECLRKHGMSARDPKAGTAGIIVDQGPGYTPEKLLTAYETCATEVPGLGRSAEHDG
ncbi:hypothetical protein ACIHCV_38000 [Streptomyces sp. NPDC051956]|uniref:hypothetical protein n=1 Tax=Streptomyces sp. NPDC051956 TaxID=3365677 RepID=UPI0037CF5BD9